MPFRAGRDAFATCRRWKAPNNQRAIKMVKRHSDRWKQTLLDYLKTTAPLTFLILCHFLPHPTSCGRGFFLFQHPTSRPCDVLFQHRRKVSIENNTNKWQQRPNPIQLYLHKVKTQRNTHLLRFHHGTSHRFTHVLIRIQSWHRASLSRETRRTGAFLRIPVMSVSTKFIFCTFFHFVYFIICTGNIWHKTKTFQP